MDVERALVSKIISTGQLEEAISKGIRADLFADDECREIFEHIVEHTRKYKTPPSMKAMQEDRPNFEIEMIQDSLAYVIDKFITMAKRRLANDQVLELAAICNDPEKGHDIDLHFLEVSRNLAMLAPSTEVHHFVGDMGKRIKEHERRKREGEKRGLPWGFPTLDAWTDGIAPHMFCTVSGFSGLGKSTFLKATAFNIWAKGNTPLFITLEEEADHIAEQFDAMAASLDYIKLKQLDLSIEQMAHWKRYRDEIREKAADIPIIDKIRHCTPDNIFAETVRHNPDVVFVDYISLMRSSRPGKSGMSMWQSITEITQDLKQNARTLGIPIVAAAQTNRSGGKEGAELDNIGNSISIIQDSDIVVGLFADDEMREHKQMEVRVNKNRRGPLGKFKAVWDYGTLTFRERESVDGFKRDSSESKEEYIARLAREAEERQGKNALKTRKKRPGT